jgi:MFS family permease
MRSKTIYYGWANLAMAALAMVATLPGRTQGLGLITEPLIADLHVSRVTYATINLWATLIGAAFCLPCGRLLDRYGSRIVLTLTVLFLGATVVGMQMMQGLAALSIAITLTRGFGQSALSVVSLALVGKWFARRLNLAMGVYALLVGIGFIAAFPSVGAPVLKYGWRGPWGSIGWVLLLVVAPLCWLIVRNQPEDRGLELDGVNEPVAKLTDLTTGEALRSPAFWIFALSSSLFGLVYSGISLFNESILVERGFNASVYHDVLVISTMLGLLANFGGGWLATKMPIQRLSGLGMAALAVALVLLPMVRTYTHVLIYGAIMGIAGGVVTVVFFSVWGQVFGRSHLGRIQGWAQMMTVFASALGPLLLAETLRSTGSYDFIFNLLAVLTVMLGLAAWFVALPVRHSTHEPDRIILSTGTV